MAWLDGFGSEGLSNFGRGVKGEVVSFELWRILYSALRGVEFGFVGLWVVGCGLRVGVFEWVKSGWVD